MAERLFETELEAWFRDSPALPDAALFAARVTDRLDRTWTFRRFIIGGLGLIGGLIGGAQVLGSGLIGRIGEAEARTGVMSHTLGARIEESPLAQSPLARALAERLSDLSGSGAEALWMSVALGLFAAGLLVTRTIREL